MLKIFTVLDNKVNAFLPPFYERATGAAVRAFEEAVNRQDHQFNKWPDDYRLFEIGVFDDVTGEISLKEKQDLGLARQYLSANNRVGALSKDPNALPLSQDINN